MEEICGILGLPDDCLLEVMKWLDMSEVVPFYGACQRLYKLWRARGWLHTGLSGVYSGEYHPHTSLYRVAISPTKVRIIFESKKCAVSAREIVNDDLPGIFNMEELKDLSILLTRLYDQVSHLQKIPDEYVDNIVIRGKKTKFSAQFDFYSISTKYWVVVIRPKGVEL